jgi:hypothetical protein
MNGDSLKEWTKVNFELVVGYPPRIMTLEKGWLVWVFKMVAKVNNICTSRWKWGSQNLFLKKWHVDFDAKTA